MNSQIFLSYKPINLKQFLTSIINENCQSHHMVCVAYVYICLEEAEMKDKSWGR